MKINYILSTTTSGATSASVKEIVGLSEKDPFCNTIVIVPEPKSIAIEREILDASKNGAFSNIFIYSFVRLLSRLEKIDESELVTKQTCIMILRKIINENYESFVCYKKTAKMVSFAEKIYETIAQIKSSGLNLEDIKEIAEKTNGALKLKMQDIYTIYSKYQEVLNEGYFDDCDKLRRLGGLAKNNEFIKQANIFVVGFDNMTNDMIEVLKQFAIYSKSITFSCCYFNENRKDAYIQKNELYNKLIGISQKLNYPYNPKFVNFACCGDFWHIQNDLFVPNAKQVKSNGNVKIFELADKKEEIDFVANSIIKMISEGYRYKDIAVVDAEFDNDIEIIEKTFKDYGISCFENESYDVSKHFFVDFIKSAIEVINSQFSAEKVLNFLSNALFDVENFSSFKNYVDEFAVNHALFLTLADENSVKNANDLENINKIIENLKKFNEKFSKIFLKQGKVIDFINGIKTLVEHYNCKEKMAEIANFERENNLLVEAEITDAITEKFDKLNQNVSKFFGNNLVTIDEFIQIYFAGFNDENINLIPISVDSILIQKNVDGLYNIKNLFVIGAVEGRFPVKMQDTGMLLDEEIDSVTNVLEKDLEPKIETINSRESYSAYETLLVPSENLFVTYANKTFGASNQPSRIVLRLGNLFDIKPIKNYAKKDYVSAISSEKEFAKHVGLFFLNSAYERTYLNDEYNKLKNVFSDKFRFYIDNINYGEKEFNISKAGELYFTNSKTSISQLEKYFSCPYKFFATYGLRLKENKVAKLSSLDVGNIIHRFAENFTKNIGVFENLDDESFEQRTRQILSVTLNELNINVRKNIAIINFIYDESIRLGRYLFEEQKNSNFKNDYKLNELEFKGKNAVRLQIGEKNIYIEGKIDRIDKFNDYIRIIDYKTGETDSNLSAIYFGKKIQLVSYLSACQNIDNSKIAGLFYFPIHSDFVKIDQKMQNNYKMQGFLLDDINVVRNMDIGLSFENKESQFVPLKIKNNKDVRETGELQINYGQSKSYLTEAQFDSLKEYTEKLCSGAIAEILDGYIEPSPMAKASDRESDECKYCALSGFCGKENARFGSARRCGGNVDNSSFELEKEVTDEHKVD